VVNSSGDLLADRRFAWATSLAAEGDHRAAADLLEQIVAQAPEWAAAWFALGEACLKSGMRGRAVDVFRQAAALDPSDRVGATLALAALEDMPAPDAAPPAYVERLFDDYAARFDSHLVDTLRYSGPAILRQAIDEAMPPPHRFRRCLDLGCGTGLMGAAIRDRVEWLEGVDLSAAMIAKARDKAIYDRLTTGDIAQAFRDAEPFDLVLAADVLVYRGELRGIVTACHAAMLPGGLFAFTLQQHEANGAPFVVGEDRRFSHDPDYVRAVAEKAGFACLAMISATTRRDAGRDVPGLVCVLRRP
jgi:predicted TPR repeat methyltransferase